jgi:alkaline phosphatase
MVNRRRFLQVSSLAASSAAVGCATSTSERSAARASRPARLGRGSPARIIHVVSDGMSLGTLSCADQLARFETGHGLRWMDLMNDPRAHYALMDMRSLDSLVTDSSAASSSWGCGARVRNGTLNVNSQGAPLAPLMQLFGEAGWKRGLVTTTEITHATPAGFTVSIDDRGKGEDIALQYLERGLDVYLGGANNHFNPAKRKDKRDIWAEFAARGYYVARNRSELQNAPLDAPWLGTFADGHLPFTIDHRRSQDLLQKVPTIAEMTGRALERLGRHDRFLLQVEGGRVDHACHNNDAAAALRDQLALDEALRLILDFQERHPDTLVVVTTDHGNANLGLNGMGSSYRGSSQSFQRVASVNASFPEILKRIKENKTEEHATKVLAETTGLDVKPEKIQRFLRFLDGKGNALFDQMNSEVAALGQLLANHLGIGFIGTTHTSDYVSLVAIGPGSERFRGLIRNTDVFRHYTDLARIDYRNPQEPLLAHGTPAEAVENIETYALA